MLSQKGTILSFLILSAVACGAASDSPLLDCPTIQGVTVCPDGGRSAAPEAAADAAPGAPDGSLGSPDVTHPVDAGTGPGVGQPCTQDSMCAGATGGLCNWKLQRCENPEPMGGPCERDQECQGGLCNWKLDVCTREGATGAPCERDVECAGGLCNWKLQACEPPEPVGGPCERDQECAGDLCNWKEQACAKKQGLGGPCERDVECKSDDCNTASQTCI